MADGKLDSKSFSVHSEQEIGIPSEGSCENCNKLKLKLNEVLAELSSTYAIIDLLQMERNIKHQRINEGDNTSVVSTTDSMNENNVKEIQENKNKNKIRKPTYSEVCQNIKPITVSNSYAYLSSLEEGDEGETAGRNHEAFSESSVYLSHCKESEGTN